MLGSKANTAIAMLRELGYSVWIRVYSMRIQEYPLYVQWGCYACTSLRPASWTGTFTHASHLAEVMFLYQGLQQVVRAFGIPARAKHASFPL